MKLESLALWDEKSLFTEQGETEKGFIGWLKGSFDEDRLILSDMVMSGDNICPMIRYELESLGIFLTSEDAEYMLRSVSDLNGFCRVKLHDHIPYSFNRECWGFRVLTEDYAWYIALTPWNPARVVTIYCYVRKVLMSSLAKAKGLPEYCHGVLKYTGERILIRFGADIYDSFPQYGSNTVENREYANEQNSALGLTVEQVAAMENGVIYGWDTPMSNPVNYDESGHFYIPTEEVKGWRR
jgi:hypothetical protein